MNSSKNNFLIFILVVAISLLLSFYFYSKLPDEAAVHFNVYGEVDSYAGKDVLLVVNLMVVISIGIVFFLIGKFIHKIPTKWLNLPNKDYWLRPERKEYSLNKTKDISYIFGAATILYLDVLFYEIYKANQMPEPKLGSLSYISLIIYILFSTFIIIKYYKDFKIPE